MAKRILCAVDFSEDSVAALRTAATLARDHQAMLVLVHVEEPPLWQNEPYWPLPGDVRGDVNARIAAELEECKRIALRLGAPEVATHLVRGAAWNEIVGLARADPDIETIVLGTHGRTGVARALIGSVAERVVRHAPCTVMVVRPRPR